MNEIDVTILNQNFSLNEENQHVHFRPGLGDIPIVEIQNAHATARISLQGAHVLSWIPTGEDEVIWLSPEATFAKGKSVRGGIPICWPWFGAHEIHREYPAHGFARTVLWQVRDVRALPGGETRISFCLDTALLDEALQVMWPMPTRLEYTLTIGKMLSMEITTFNDSDKAIIIGQALHTYFKVHDVNNTTLTGLENKDYLDKTEGFQRKYQVGAVTIDGEVDRIYLQTSDDVVINDQHRNIRVTKQGSCSTVVWNPGQQTAEKMADLGRDGYRHMLCVESANAADDVVSIAAGGQHSLYVTYVLD